VLTPGTSLVGTGATLVRPANTGENLITLRSVHSGENDSEMTLVQGVTIDGQRDQQGAFEGLEKQNAHLLFLGGDVETPGRLRAQVQGVSFLSGTGDGLAVGPNADVTACNSVARDVFREGLSVHGGNTRLRVRDFDASATLGTTGMWLDGDIVGFGDSRTTDIEMENVSLETGDLEIAIAEGSRLEFRNLVMGAAPFRLSAPTSSVRILDSTLWIGVPSDRHNHFASPDDVEILRSTVIASESQDEGASLEETDREWAAIRVLWSDPDATTSQITFDSCTFSTAPDVEATDRVYVAESPNEGGQLVIRSGELDGCACDWFAPTCLGCSLEP